MVAAWPSSIQIVQLLPVSFAPVDMRYIFATAAGEAKTAPASTDQVYLVGFDVLMTGANIENDFLSWWEIDLRRGAERFTGLEDVLNDTVSTQYQFAEQNVPVLSVLRGGTTHSTRLWRAPFRLYQYSRGGSFVPPPATTTVRVLLTTPYEAPSAVSADLIASYNVGGLAASVLAAPYAAGLVATSALSAPYGVAGTVQALLACPYSASAPSGTLEAINGSATQVAVTVAGAPFRQTMVNWGFGMGVPSEWGGTQASWTAQALPVYQAHAAQLYANIGTTILRINTFSTTCKSVVDDAWNNRGVDHVHVTYYNWVYGQIAASATALVTELEAFLAAGMHCTSISPANEPSWTDDPSDAMQAIRTELDNRGHANIVLFPPEFASNDGQTLNFHSDVISGGKIGTIGGGACHSYNMGSGPDLYDDRLLLQSKAVWQFELGNGDWLSVAQRVCGDLNNGVASEVWHHGQAPNDGVPTNTLGGSQRLVNFDGTSNVYYIAWKMLANAFPRGTVMRLVSCNWADANINARVGQRGWYTYGVKPPVSFAAGKQAAGAWRFAVCNGTYGTDSFADVFGGHYHSQLIQTTITFAELSGVNGTWTGTRALSDGSSTSISYPLVNGQLRITLGSSDLVVLGDSPGTQQVPRTFYVATNGNNGNPGTSASPFLTINGAQAAVVPPLTGGDTLIVKAGTYVENVVITRGGSAATGYLTIKAETRGTTFIRPTSGFSAFVIQQDWVIVDGFDVSGGAACTGHGIEATWLNGVSGTRGPQHLNIRYCTCHDNSISGIGVAYGDYYTIEYNTIYGNCHAPPQSIQGSGISIYQPRAADTASTPHNAVQSNQCWNNIVARLSNGIGGPLYNYSPATVSSYLLQAGSTMLNNGLDLQAVFAVNPGTRDFYGITTPSGGAYAIGASETGAVGTSGQPRTSPPNPSTLGTTYYVRPGGSDAADGLSDATAWATIAKVNGQTYSPNDKILFRGGDTFSGSLSFTATSWVGTGSTNFVTIGAYGAGRATINSGSASGLSVINNAGVVIRDFIFVGNGTADVDGVLFQNKLAGSGKLSYIGLYNLDVSSYGRSGVAIFGGYGPLGTGGNDFAGFDNITIDTVRAHNNTGVSLAPNFGTSGINIMGRYGYNATPTPTHTNVVIRNCVTDFNSGKAGSTKPTGSGIFIGQTQTGLIEFSVAHDNGLNNTLAGGPVGIWTGDSSSITMQYCESYHNRTSGGDGGGFDIDGGCTNCMIQYCYSHNNDGHGFLLYNYADPGFIANWDNNTVRYCISENDGAVSTPLATITIASDGVGLTNVRVYNNTFYKSSATGNIFSLYGTITSGLVANNILYSVANAWLVSTAINLSGLQFRGNDYWATGTFRILWSNLTYSTLAAWRTASGQEPSTGFSVNPLLTSPGGGGTLLGYPGNEPDHTEGNGIVCHDFRNTDATPGSGTIYPYTTVVENNLCYGNGGSGVRAFKSNNCMIKNNTCYHNNQDLFSLSTWRDELANVYGSANTWANNIGVTDTPAITSLNSPFQAATRTAIGDRDIVSDENTGQAFYNNLTFNGTAGVTSIAQTGSISGTLITTTPNFNKLGVNPLFMAPLISGTPDFTLQSTSPAINAGTSAYGVATFDLAGNTRVLGSAVDIGAYEASLVATSVMAAPYSAAAAPASNVLSISGRTWLLNGQPFEMWGVRVAVAAMSENLTVELINNLDAYKANGINSVTVTYAGASCLYWGSPNGPAGSPFSSDGLTIDAATQARMERIIQACDDRQMVVHVNTWYSRAGFGATTNAAARQIHKTVATKLLQWRNVVISPGGETDNSNYSDTNGIFNLLDPVQIGVLGADIHSIDPTRIYAAGGLGDTYNIQIGQNANVNALSWDPPTPVSPGVNASKYNTYAVTNGINKPIFDNELDFRAAPNDTVGVFTNTQKNNYYTEVNAKLGIGTLTPAALPGLQLCFFSEPWQQAQGQFPPAGSGTGEPGVHFELGGYGTVADPGIKWFWDYVRGYKTISSTARTFTAASSNYLSRAEGLLYPLTICAWAKVTSIAVDYAIAGFGDLTASNRRQMLLSRTTGITMQSRTDTGTSAEAISLALPAANNWFHAAGVVTSASSRAVYLNGHDKGTNATNIVSTIPSQFAVGATTIPSLYINGNVAEVAVWSVALSDTEIAQLAGGAALPTAIQAASLWGYWRVDGSNPELDLSGHGRNLTVHP